MFNECFSLEELNLFNFDIRKTIFMTGIFAGFSSLKFLDILNFNTNNMRYMFYECVSLEEIIISNFDTENIDNMSYLFFKYLSIK